MRRKLFPHAKWWVLLPASLPTRQLFGHGAMLQWIYMIQSPDGGMLKPYLAPSKTNTFFKAEFYGTYPGYQV